MEASFDKKTSVKIVPVIDTIPADLLTPLSVYLKLSKGSTNSFLLESVEGGESLARYSFIGTSDEIVVPGPDNRSVTINGETAFEGTSMLDFLRDHFSGCEIVSDEELPPFLGGAIGYLGFNCTGWFEPSLHQDHPSEEPDAKFIFLSSVVAFDHAKQTIKIISLARGKTTTEMAREQNAAIRRTLEYDSIQLPETRGSTSAAPVTSNWTRQDFEDSVRKIKELIRAGECYQVVISQCFSRPTTAHPVAIYRAIRSLNPSPYMFLLQMADRSVIGASPEMLVKCSGRDLEYRPIAGTRPRGKTAEDDARLAEEMRVDQKEVAEHLMLVDLGRNDLGRVAEYGSVRVDNLMSVEKYSHVQHLVSHLSAKLRPGLDRFDALASCFPAGTVSGAPKVRATEIIQKMEPDARGVYAGSVGYFDYAGNMDTCIAIRTLVLKNGIAHVQAGAGIVADSLPENEFDETVNKARALLKAVELAEGKNL